jgi:tripartite-type tricarboxylate transporter receptor subunit TctC
MIRVAALLASLIAALPIARPAQAQPYPAKPIRIIIPFPAGGASDVIARAIAEKLRPRLGQPFVVENRPGANQIVGATSAMAAPPDGYTLLWATVSLTSLNPHLLKKLPYDPDKSFVPVSLLYQTNEYLIVSSELAVDTLEQFIALARSKPGGISYASFGTGTLGHLQGVALAKAAGIDLNHVPYKGMAQVVPDLMTSRVQAVFTSIWSVMSQIQQGQLKVLALAQDRRSSNMPTVPTYRESGIDLIMSAWLGLLAPAGTPKDIVDRISREFAAVVKDPEFRATLTDKQDLIPVGNLPHEFADFIKKNRDFWGPIVKASGVALD